MMTPTSLPPPLPPESQGPAHVPPAASPPLDYVRAGADQQSNVPATIGLVCGVLLFVPYLAGIAALVLGRIGLRRADDLGGRGRRVAQAAMVLGVVNLVLAVLLTAAAFPAMARARQQARQIQCMSNLRQVSLAMMMYAQDHKGFVPPNLDALQKYFGSPATAAAVCTCPDAARHAVPPASIGSGTTYSYIYAVPSVPRQAQIRNPWAVPAAYEPLANHGGRGINVVYWDGHVEWHAAAAAQRIIAQIQASQAALPPAATEPRQARPGLANPGPESE